MRRAFWVAAGLSFGILFAGGAYAARNASGSYSLPAGNPVISGTKITSAWANALTADIANELGDSASRSGKGGFTAPVRGVDGSAAAPSHSFTSDTDSGLYLQAAGNVRVAAAGADSLVCTATGVSVPGTLGVTGVATFAAGPTISAGNISLVGAAGQGLWKSGAILALGTLTNHAIDVRINGAASWTFATSGALTSAGGTITGLPTPTLASDAATKGYADTVAPAQSKVIAAGTINSDGTLSGVFGATASRSALGTYVVTPTAITANYVPVVTKRGAGFAYISVMGASNFTVITMDAASPPAAVDAAFNFIVLAGP